MFAGFPSMARRPDGLARHFGAGPLANDNEQARCSASTFPPGVRAIVEPVPVSTNRGGCRPGGWRVRFRPRWGPSADPLTGWTGGGDPVGMIELRFPDRRSAEAYCRREGIAFNCAGSSSPPQCAPRILSDPVPMLCCWPTGPHALCCGAYPIAA